MASSAGAVYTAARHLSSAIRRNAGVRKPISVLPTRAHGWGLPLPPEEPEKGPLPEEYELWWGGEHVYEEPPDHPIGPYEALGLLCCGLGFFVAVEIFANTAHKYYFKQKMPPREFPWLDEWDRMVPVEQRRMNYGNGKYGG